MTWIPTVSGRAIDLVHPTAGEVDFGEIAHALARLNRYSGNAALEVSVGLHLLIGLDLCPTATLRAHWLLHDGHESRLGDETRPVRTATRAVAEQMFDSETADRIEAVRAELRARHDVAIYTAAGLSFPDALTRAAIDLIDLRALATERRDFLRRGSNPRPWSGLDDREPPILPATRVWRPLPPVEVETRLVAAFRTHLPALALGRRAS